MTTSAAALHGEEAPGLHLTHEKLQGEPMLSRIERIQQGVTGRATSTPVTTRCGARLLAPMN